MVAPSDVVIGPVSLRRSIIAKDETPIKPFDCISHPWPKNQPIVLAAAAKSNDQLALTKLCEVFGQVSLIGFGDLMFVSLSN